MSAHSRQNLLHDAGRFDAGEFFIQAAEGVGELRVIEAEEVEQRGVEVADVDRIGDRRVADRVGLAVTEAALSRRRRRARS